MCLNKVSLKVNIQIYNRLQSIKVNIPQPMFHGSSASLVAQLVKNLAAMQETLVQFLGREDPLEKG